MGGLRYVLCLHSAAAVAVCDGGCLLNGVYGFRVLSQKTRNGQGHTLPDIGVLQVAHDRGQGGQVFDSEEASGTGPKRHGMYSAGGVAVFVDDVVHAKQANKHIGQLHLPLPHDPSSLCVEREGFILDEGFERFLKLSEEELDRMDGGSVLGGFLLVETLPLDDRIHLADELLAGLYQEQHVIDLDESRVANETTVLDDVVVLHLKHGWSVTSTQLVAFVYERGRVWWLTGQLPETEDEL